MNRILAAGAAACMLAPLFSQPAVADTRPDRGGHTLGQDFQMKEAELRARSRGGHLLGPDSAAAARPIAKPRLLVDAADTVPCPSGCAGTPAAGK